MFHHSTKHKNKGYLLAGSILILMGMVVFIVPFFHEVETDPSKIVLVGGIPFLSGIVLISTYSGTTIDFEKKQLKKYQSILWFKLGKWENLPRIETAELVHYTYQSRNTPNGISPTISAEITTYKCVIKLEGKKLQVFDYANEKDAIRALAQIQEGLRL
ncbi:hypothetical protein [Algoriphagus boseongensis]|uniref:hypothetical protein n=1 Tax=Algoriphagus boseongensis TaxID=1442587 RepID=UPI001AAC971B|nr:hypothetical protein [Algoriphagus boseongensis]